MDVSLAMARVREPCLTLVARGDFVEAVRENSSHHAYPLLVDHMSEDLRILALETTGLSGSVAALVGERVKAERELAAGSRSAKSLAPGIATVLDEVGWKPTDVQLIGVAVGPGSFTGLRVGITTAKTLAYVTGAGVVGIDALEVIAAQSPASTKSVWAAFDAQRGELFVARWENADTADALSWKQTTDPRIVDGQTWIAKLAAGEAVSGPGVRRWRDGVPACVQQIAEDRWQPQASTIGKLAWRKFQAGERQDLWGLSPNYMRASAAEEKLAANRSSNAVTSNL
jgi:tRNA threonylcarbamoyladenosine biosynthesis protein TsaB